MTQTRETSAPATGGEVADKEASGEAQRYGPGDPGYRKILFGAMCAGLASFNALYATQALLPSLSTDFGVTPTTTALTVSATTGALALTVVPASIISERVGRRLVLQVSVIVATVLSLLLAFMPSIGALIALRALQGVAVAGVPAVAMAYLSEEIRSEYLPKIMGFYIAGTTLGGLCGRLIPGFALEILDWRGATIVSAIFALSTALFTAAILPKQRYFTPKKITFARETAAFTSHIRNPTLIKLFILPFLIMGAFVSLYNYLGFRLISQFGLPESLAAFVFILYLSGTWSSARAGTYMHKFGRGTVMAGSVSLALVGLLLLMAPWLWTTILGAFLFTASFFAAHSTASSWVGLVARHDRAEASSTYVLSYYLGSSIIGWISGYFFAGGWIVLLSWLCALFGMALILSVLIWRSRRNH
ncbi:MFS transporter [Corynebacterium sp. 4HC-13]|uniref:MFS transporter n=1 Tax=Corynebacterium anserum TaxID=2684406 RepID=UPI00163A0A4E|nr:MFS transporter [Corynebacterium anserum]MBC2681437.1 MFS transporter [Corynebacterium anserum]